MICPYLNPNLLSPNPSFVDWPNKYRVRYLLSINLQFLLSSNTVQGGSISCSVITNTSSLCLGWHKFMYINIFGLVFWSPFSCWYRYWLTPHCALIDFPCLQPVKQSTSTSRLWLLSFHFLSLRLLQPFFLPGFDFINNIIWLYTIRPACLW